MLSLQKYFICTHHKQRSSFFSRRTIAREIWQSMDYGSVPGKRNKLEKTLLVEK